METLANGGLRLVLAVLGLAAAARIQFRGIPVLWLLAAAVVLALAAVVLLLVRSGRRDGWLRLRAVAT